MVAILNAARLFDGIDEFGSPYVAATRVRVHDPTECERILAFLRGGTLVLRTTGRAIDLLDKRRGKVVPLSFRTDGSWVWSDAIAYYLADHHLGPDAEFLRHMRASCYSAQVAPAEAVLEALAVLRNRSGFSEGGDDER